ncbi:PEP-CTERM sorting domain-containing protein [Phormidium sp. CLA17]|uniref:amidase family protein n=1 Tax=Leptolyngbya sp. Cla-17 TaxID=2803751 RepID=UPI00149245FB|nr:amidase family protein [Leptolyngbya sp. Cla-17]MBM0743941.1 PEP-CTERM sorting domain-containing protein [Leptolyngbya sp. Cla-17]
MLQSIKRVAIAFASQSVIVALTPSITPAFTLTEATVSSVQTAFSAGDITCTGLTQLYLNRIAAYDKQGPAINSIIAVNPNALAIAAQLDAQYAQSGPTGSLHCVPVILKDNFDTVDVPTTAGALALKDFYPGSDAFQVQKLREAGALILAKSNLSEFAFNLTSVSSLGGTTLNPYDTARNVGGSSGGTGAAIAANFGLLGFGTDTGGSIRVPSSFNSLVGIRPTIGLSSRDGIIPLALSQDVGGPMARTVADAAAALSVVAGYDPNDPITAGSIGNMPISYTNFLDPNGLKGARIGVVRGVFGLNSNPESVKTNAVINDAISRIGLLGAEVVDVTIPNLATILGYPSLSRFEFKRDLNNYLADRPVPPSGVRTLEDIIASGLYLKASEAAYIDRNSITPPDQNPDYQKIIQERPGITQSSLLQALTGLDALIYPSVASPPNLLTANLASGSANRLSPFSGFPAITVPAGFTVDGLPVGLEFLGRAYDESTLIKLAYSFEQGTLFRQAPDSTPALPGETVAAVPEPSTVVALGLAGLGLLGAKRRRRQSKTINL